MEIFKRKIYKDMVNWKNEDAGSTALMIDGARRVGKSTIVETFAKENYRSYILIDFSEQKPTIKEIFDLFPIDKELFFDRLQLQFDTKMYHRESAIIFDEVQFFPRARELIKFLVKDGRYDYIETGSLISLIENTKDIQIPSEERHLHMYPMSFEEFLIAIGEGTSISKLEEFFHKKIPLSETIHRKYMEYFKTYMIVGGMPQTVSKYVETREITSAETVKRQILDLYKSDATKIKNKNVALRVVNLIDGIPSLLSSSRKVFMPGKIKKNSRSSSFATGIEWLTHACVFLMCNRITDPSPAINMYDDESSFKCYFLDTGLLFTLAFGSDINKLKKSFREIISNKLNLNEGMFFENVVAQELKCNNHSLKFIEMKKADGRYYEVDFVLDKIDGCDLIEVKSAQSTRHKSMDIISKKFSDRVKNKIVIHTKDLRKDEDILYVPAYLTMFIK